MPAMGCVWDVRAQYGRWWKAEVKANDIENV